MICAATPSAKPAARMGESFLLRALAGIDPALLGLTVSADFWNTSQKDGQRYMLTMLLTDTVRCLLL